MKATELIAELQKIVDEHGDLPCMFFANYGLTIENFKKEMISIIETDGPQGKFKALVLEDII